MNRYLEKIAEEAVKRKELSPETAVDAILGGGLAYHAVNTLNSNVTGPALYNAMGVRIPKSEQKSSWRDVKSFMRKHNLHHQVSLNAERLGVGTTSPGYLPSEFIRPGRTSERLKGRGLILGIRPHIATQGMHNIMHELGHVKDLSTGGRLERKIKTTLAKNVRLTGMAPRLAGTAALAALGDEDTRPYAPLIASIPAASVLRQEAAATFHGFNHLRKHGAPGAARQFMKIFTPAFGTYAAGAAALPLGVYTAKKIIDNADE